MSILSMLRGFSGRRGFFFGGNINFKFCHLRLGHLYRYSGGSHAIAAFLGEVGHYIVRLFPDMPVSVLVHRDEDFAFDLVGFGYCRLSHGGHSVCSLWSGSRWRWYAFATRQYYAMKTDFAKVVCCDFVLVLRKYFHLIFELLSKTATNRDRTQPQRPLYPQRFNDRFCHKSRQCSNGYVPRLERIQ